MNAATLPRLSRLGRAIASEAFKRHPPPWRVLGSGVVDAKGQPVVTCAGDLAGAALLLDVFGEFVLPVVNRAEV